MTSQMYAIAEVLEGRGFTPVTTDSWSNPDGHQCHVDWMGNWTFEYADLKPSSDRACKMLPSYGKSVLSLKRLLNSI